MKHEFLVQPMIGRSGKAFYRILRRGNHDVLHTSEAYYSTWNRDRAVKRLVALGGGLFKIAAGGRLPD
jgi:hypothetical protein